MKYILYFLFTTLALSVADYSGEWEYKVATPDGQTVSAAFVISKTSDGYTGVARGAEGEIPLNNLKIEGESFSCNIDYMGYKVNFSGTFEGDVLNATGDVDGFQFPVEAKKKK